MGNCDGNMAKYIISKVYKTSLSVRMKAILFMFGGGGGGGGWGDVLTVNLLHRGKFRGWGWQIILFQYTSGFAT